MFPQQQQQPYFDAKYTTARPPPLPPHHPSNYAYHTNYVVPPEPAPNATNAQPTPILSIPEIADFASSIVFLMWHARRASVMALHENSKSIQSSHTDDRHLGHSKETATIANKTSTAFKKFCKQVLSATQLSESVILLSLKYIAMLLQNNPSIQGAEGSEYRLFTVALMLANKFLDDNTFTNKTWSEVSGMKVTDLNIMELEFLDVLRFKLFIRNDEFERWKSALFVLKNQLEEAQKYEQQQQQQQQLLFEETFKGIVLPNQQQQAQQQQQLLYMLSKSAQLPQFPTQPLNRPLTRVPLRIPVQPVWRHLQQQQQDYTNNTTTSDYYQQTPSTDNTLYSYIRPTNNTNNYTNYSQSYSQPIMNNYRVPQAQDFNTSYTTPTTTTATTTTTNDNSNYYYPTLRNRTSFYNEQTEPLDYSSYDMSGSQSTNDIYSRPTYPQQQQPFRPTSMHPPTMYNNTNNTTRKYNGPVPEDPLTARDSYQTQ